MAAPPEKKQKTEDEEAENVEMADEKKKPEPPKEHEEDAKPLMGGKVSAVEFLVPDTTVNLMTSTVGDLIMPLQDNGLAMLAAGARASVGIKSGRYMFDVQIVERRNSWNLEGFLKIGFSIAGSSLLGDSDTSIYFDSAERFNNNKWSTGDVVSCLLNLEKDSPNFNTISLFKNGARASPPQALPESLHGKPLFPAIIFRCMTLRPNFGAEPICSLPFKCHMVGSALKTDAEVTTYDATDEGKVLFPVSLPDEGSFDWLDMYLENNPGYTEISDRAIRAWTEKSCNQKLSVPPKTSNDKPEMPWGLEGSNVKTALKTLCSLQKRKYVVMEVKGNLVKEDREEALKLFKAANFKTSAAVLVGTPSPDFKKRSQMLLLKQKQDVADKEHHQKFLATHMKWLAGKKKKETEKACKKAAKEKEKAAKSIAKAVEVAKKRAAAAKEGKEFEEEEKKEEEPEEEEPEEDEPEEPEPVEDDPPKIALTDEEKQLTFKPVVIPDLAPYVMNTSFAKFSLPEKEEGFDEIQYEFLKDGAKCKKAVRDWISGRKLTTRVEDIKPSDWFCATKKAWGKAVQDWQAALAKHAANVAKKRAEKAAREAKKQQAAVKAAAAKAKAEAEKAKAEAEKKDGEGKDDDKKEEVVEKSEDEEMEEEPEPEVDFEGIDIFGVDDVTDIGGGMPLHKDFTNIDWILMSLAFELHALAHSFKKDCGDEDIPGLHVDHLDFYYQKYFNRGFSPQSFGKETAKDVVELVPDAVLVDSKGVLVNCLQEDMETYQVFVKITEEARRYRGIRTDMGDESAELKLAAQHGNDQWQNGKKRKKQQSWGDWAPQGAQGGKGSKGGWGHGGVWAARQAADTDSHGKGQKGWTPTPPGKQGKKGKGWGK